MGRESLGEFEKVVLLAILQLGGESYGAPILDEIERRAGQTPSSGTLYVALRRLERRGLLASCFGDPTPERGHRSQELWSNMADGLGPVLEGES
jgi:hypothetical protein